MVPTAMHIMHDPTGATGIGHTDTGTTVEKSALDVRRAARYIASQAAGRASHKVAGGRIAREEPVKTVCSDRPG